jgi:predicted nucleic acid-binding protein
MSAYIDTSVLIAAHVSEPHTPLAQTWLGDQCGNHLLVSSWTLVECESALAIKRRRGEIDAVTQLATITDLEIFVARLAPPVLPTEIDYRQAREFCRNAESGLRAGDALHLAMALRLDARRFATLDSILASNAAAHGLEPAVIPASLFI